jgi:hypothetical protein
MLKGRFTFLPVDVAIWASALWMATCSVLRYSRASSSWEAMRASIDEAAATARGKESSEVRHTTSDKE